MKLIDGQDKTEGYSAMIREVRARRMRQAQQSWRQKHDGEIELAVWLIVFIGGSLIAFFWKFR